MTEPNEQHSIARQIVLATDLSPRCDRALDRAVSLARGSNAQLLAVHALETTFDNALAQSMRNLPSWRSRKDRAQSVKRELCADITEVGVIADVLIEEGDPGDVVLSAARKTKAELIITGMARGEFLGRLLLGSTVDALVRNAWVPVLVVKRRARRPYEHVVVATDFSNASRDALHTAVEVFADCKITLFHAHDAPYASFTDPDSTRDAWAKIAHDECARFLDAAKLSDDVRRRLAILIEYGHPAQLLYDYLGIEDADVVLVGVPTRGAVVRALVGSRAEEMLRYLPCDVMAVPERRTAAT